MSKYIASKSESVKFVHIVSDSEYVLPIYTALWREESPAVKNKFDDLADQKKREHEEKYPGMIHDGDYTPV